MSLVDCLSKKQPAIEKSVFGAKFVAMKHVMEGLHVICYKLLMMAVPLSGYYYVYVDNMSDIHNTQQTESTLRNKSNSICYHNVCDSLAMGDTNTTHIYGSNLLTKLLYGAKRKKLVRYILYDIYDLFILLSRKLTQIKDTTLFRSRKLDKYGSVTCKSSTL